MAKGVVGGEKIPFLAEFIDEDFGIPVRQHPGGGADAEGCPVAGFAGELVDMAAGAHEDLAMRLRELAERERDGGADRADEEVHIILGEQAAGFVQPGGGAAGVVLHQDFHRPAEDATFGVELLGGHGGTLDLALPEYREIAGGGVDLADFDGAGLRPADGGRGQAGAQHRTAGQNVPPAEIYVFGHACYPPVVR